MENLHADNLDRPGLTLVANIDADSVFIAPLGLHKELHRHATLEGVLGYQPSSTQDSGRSTDVRKYFPYIKHYIPRTVT